MRKLLLILAVSVIWHTTFAQTPTLQQKLYYTCKVWGFVKYYHSGVSTCSVNWDSVLLHTLPLVRNATTNNQFNDALDTMLAAAGPMALSTSYFPDTLPTELKRNRDFIWIDSSSFRSDVKIILDTIKNNFRPHPICYIEVGPYTRSLSDPWGGYLHLPYDTTLLNVNTATSYPDGDHRLLMMFKFWNIVRYFNPYNYALDNPWDTTLAHYVIPMDTVGNSQSLYLLCLNMATTMDDAHVYDLTYSNSYQMPPGFFQPLIRLKYVDSQYIVIKSSETGIYPGDAIITIDRLTTVQWEDSLKQYYSSGNMSVLKNTICQKIFGRQVNSTSETLVVKDSTGINHTYNVSCKNPNSYLTFFNNWYYPADSIGFISWTTMPCDIGYVNMGNLQPSDVNAMYNDLQNKSAIIFDLRNYPNATEGDIANLIFPNSIDFANLMFPDVTYPGTYYWTPQFLGIIGNPTPYTGKVIILMNEVTLSQAEYSCMILGAIPGAVKVGSQTSGADGNVTWFSLSNDMRFGYTSLGVFYPNGDSTQRIGIVPDSVVYPTRAGIRHHDDEVLDKALEIAGCNLYTKNTKLSQATIQVFPNPANDLIIIEASNLNAQEATINITDITGRILLQKTMENNSLNFSTSIGIKTLAAGMYFVTVKADGRQYVKKIVKE